MYIAIYLIVIFCFCALALALFFYYRNREKKKLEEFNKGGKAKLSEQADLKMPTVETEAHKDIEFMTDEELSKSKPTIDAQFEDFSLNMDEEKEKENETQNVNLRSSRQSSLEEKFAEYEQFLQRHMGRRVDERNDLNGNAPFGEITRCDEFEDSIPDSETSELDALANFDFDMLSGKSESEIELIISSLPEKAQQILREDILGRRDVD